MTEDYSSPSSHRRKISDPLSRLSDISSGSSFNSVGGSNPGSPRLLPRRARQQQIHVTNTTKSPILSSSNSNTISSSPVSAAFSGKHVVRPSSNSSLGLMDIENDDFLSGMDSGVSGNFSTDSVQFNHSGQWERRSPRHMSQNRSGKQEINWQEKCLGLQLELHRFKHQASQVKDILQDKVSHAGNSFSIP
ncbi:hypothetical protein RUM44_013650 [Polyplax serrata]|uniref:Uncharacterized protein n=1 Tax=Polyplax serrata TaxID=468196 RepID=A0ABR1BJ04_POLSC